MFGGEHSCSFNIFASAIHVFDKLPHFNKKSYKTKIAYCSATTTTKSLIEKSDFIAVLKRKVFWCSTVPHSSAAEI